MEIFKYKKPLSLMSKSKRFGVMSVVILLLAIGLIVTKGFNLGVDFAGGTLIQVKYENVYIFIRYCGCVSIMCCFGRN